MSDPKTEGVRVGVVELPLESGVVVPAVCVHAGVTKLEEAASLRLFTDVRLFKTPTLSEIWSDQVGLPRDPEKGVSPTWGREITTFWEAPVLV